MSETTILRSSAINRSASPNSKPGSANAELSGALPMVQVNMNSGGQPKVNYTSGLSNQPAKQGVVILQKKEQQQRAIAVPPALTADQLLLCRHLAEKYLGEARAAIRLAESDGAAAADVEFAEATIVANVKLAEATIVAIDAAMTAMTAAAALAATPPPPPRTVATSGRSTQGVSSVTPRRVARPAPAPVIVTMNAGEPVLVKPDPGQVPAPEQTENDAQG